MTKNGWKLWKSLTCLVLCAAMLLGYLPGASVSTEAATTYAYDGYGKKVADPSTVNDWKGAHSLASTANAGGIWTDKSVFTDAASYIDATDEEEKDVNIEIGENNFLVALSALATTKSIEGYSYLPSDTVLVLDLSASVYDAGAMDDMVRAANDAIKRLMDLNHYNRVAVVAYSGNSNFGNSNKNTATVILPLDRYTAQNDFLQYQWSSQYGYQTYTGIRVANGVKNSNNQTMSQTSKVSSGGTYIQNGLYQGWEQFEKVEDTAIGSGPMAGTTRIPIMVLMSDGAPTAVTQNYQNVGNSTGGDGGETSAGASFLTQLTASYVHNSMEEKYGREPLFYTLGLSVGKDENALAVLDPEDTENNYNGNNTTTERLWSQFNNLQNTSMEVNVEGSQKDYKLSVTNNGSVYNDNDDEYTLSPKYVDDYFPASNTQGLIQAFADIVDQIIIQSMYYPTLVTAGETEDTDGHIEFTDYLGANMEVKQIEGIQLGTTLHTGEKLAYTVISGGAGSIENPTDVGDNLVWAVRDRLGLKAGREGVLQAHDLIGQAYEAGQLAYNASTGEFSNYVGWYGDNSGTFLAFWDGNMETADQNAPEGAYTVNKSYLFLDAVGEGHRETDMLYASIRVETVIAENGWDNTYGVHLNKGETTVIGMLPASLVPMIQYEIGLSGTELESIESFKCTQMPPSRLLYEVGLSSQIDLLDIAGTAPENTAIEYDAKGNYVFYTNQWHEWDGSTGIKLEDAWEYNANAYYEPSMENEQYYFHENTPLYANENSTEAVSNVISGTQYYRRYIVYTERDGKADAEWVYEKIDQSVTSNSENILYIDNVAYIKKGVARVYAEPFMKIKEENNTSTLLYSDYPFVHEVNTENSSAYHQPYHVDDILGNNGKLTLPAYEGIMIGKEIDDTLTGTDYEYEFTITATTGDTSAAFSGNCILIIEDANGLRVNQENGITFTNGNATITLKAGQKAYILADSATTSVDLSEVTFTVAEKETGNYEVEEIRVNGTKDENAENSIVLAVTGNTITKAVFLNTKVTTGDIVISKTVNSVHDSHKTTEFEFVLKLDAPTGVTLKDSYSAEIVITETDNEGTPVVTTKTGAISKGSGSANDIWVFSAAEGVDAALVVPSSSFNLKHSAYIRITGLDAGIVVNVEEIDLPNGFTSNQDLDTTAEGMDNQAQAIIETGKTSAIHYVNTYKAEPTSPETNFDVKITKNVTNGELWSGGTFNFKLQKFNPASNQFEYIEQSAGNNLQASVEIAANTNSGETEVSVEGITFDAAGTYYYRIVEDATDPLPAIIYDPVMCYFSIVVTDDGAGQLKISDVVEGSDTKVENEEVDDATKSISSADINVTFTNEYTLSGAAEAIIHLDKVIYTNDEGKQATIPASGFNFDLYKSNASWEKEALEKTVVTDALGDAIIHLIYDETTETGDFYYLLEEKVPEQGDGRISYSRAQYKIHVTVTPTNGQYKIDVTVTKPDGTILEASNGPIEVNPPTAQVYIAEIGSGVEFINEFTPTPVSLTIPIAGTKVLSNWSSANEPEFTFELYCVGQDFVVAQGATPIVDKTIGGGDIVFDVGSFANSGTYYYVVKEKLPEGATPENGYTVNGITYDTSEYHVTVTVTGNNTTGVLTAAITSITKNGENLPIRFVNEYKATPIKAAIQGTKTMTGLRTLTPNAFSFALYAADSNYEITDNDPLQTVTNGAVTNNTSPFRFDLDITEAGTKYYVVKEVVPSGITEVNPSRNGLTFDLSQYNVEVETTDTDSTGNPIGVLQSEVTISKAGTTVESADFTNSYTVTPTSVTLEGTKELGGADLSAFSGENGFKFGLYAATVDNGVWTEGALQQTATMSDEGKLSFDPIKYDQPTVARYIVREIVGNDANVDYDTSVYHVTVTVRDNLDGTLRASTSIMRAGSTTEQALKFANTYNPDPITDTELNIGGTKTYTKTMTDGQFTFELYNASYDATTGRYTKSGDAILTAKNKNSAFVFIDEEDDTTTVNVDESTKYLTFSNPGGYAFIMKEQIPEGAQLVNGKYKKDGVAYDSTEYLVIVVITESRENGKDKLTGKVYYYNNDQEFTDQSNPAELTAVAFNNTYAAVADGDISIGGLKSYTGQALTNDKFTFVLYEASYDAVTGKMTAGAEKATVGNVGNSFIFPSFEITTEGDYYFIVEEDVPTDAVLITEGEHAGEYLKDNIYYDAGKYVAKVKVADNGKGKIEPETPEYFALCADETLGDAVTTVTFNNAYEPDPVVIPENPDDPNTELGMLFKGTKALIGGAPIKAGDFTFLMYRADYTWAKIAGEPLKAAVNDKGEFIFTNPNGANENFVAKAAGEYYFIVEEAIENADRVTYDTTQYCVIVTVADDGNGKLYVDESKTEIVKINMIDGILAPSVVESFAFTNVYKPVEANVVISAEKNLYDGYGKEIAMENAAYSFAIYQTDNKYTLNENQNPVATVKNDANGLVQFRMQIDTIGNHYYVIREIKGDQADLLYDETQYQVCVEVSNVNGQLVAAPTIMMNNKAVEKIVFNNAYTPVVDANVVLTKTQKVNDGEYTNKSVGVEEGDFVTYRIQVTNDSKVTAQGIVVTDVVPEGLTILHNTITMNGVEQGNVITWKLADLAAGQTVELTFEVLIPEVEKDTKWTNIVTAIFDNNSDNPENDTTDGTVSGDPGTGDDKIMVESNEVTIEQIESVLTGDANNMMLWVVLAVVCVGALAGIGVAMKKQKKND